ncbi:hypothetical protein [Rhodanobacter sp. MP1X3]|uniref:hypothetical protein n=1 Tax=Rhodanobacter sp. MP1X3 TaxID=2723086 RepID=UPI00161D4831|nr:hypothetical protein [Rhodanobacter sp. MP1X3]MBB6243642.1 hypothetical protein [Rhodanobacter sp. MP1X3]
MFFLKAILMLIFPFYRVNLPVFEYPSDLTYAEYNHGIATKNVSLSKSNQTYIDLRIFLDREKAGWKYDLTTYAPYHLFTSKIIKINCIDNKVVINFRNDDVWVQISKQIHTPCPTVSNQAITPPANGLPHLPGSM